MATTVSNKSCSFASSPCSYAKKDSEAAGAQARLKDLEAQVNTKEAVLATALSEKRALEASLADLQGHIEEVRMATLLDWQLSPEMQTFLRLNDCFESMLIWVVCDSHAVMLKDVSRLCCEQHIFKHA